jgi:hypothetical protein
MCHILRIGVILVSDCCLQVVVEAVRSLSACFLAVPAQENAALNEEGSMPSGNDSPHALSIIVKHRATLHESLTKARYHQIKQCRDVAVEALSILKSMLPATAIVSVPAEKSIEKPVATKAINASSRKGPWLHQKQAARPEEAETQSCATPAGTSATERSAALASLAASQRHAVNRHKPRTLAGMYNVCQEVQLNISPENLICSTLNGIYLLYWVSFAPYDTEVLAYVTASDCM